MIHGRILTAACVGLLALVVPVAGQSASGGPEGTEGARLSTGATFLAVAETFPDIEARALLVREPGRDVVVLRPEAVTVEVLAMALMVLDDVRARHGAPGGGQLVPIVGYAMTAPPTGTHLLRLERALDRLEREPTTDLGSLGLGRWIALGGR